METVIRETDLPGIGRKCQVSTRSGDKLVIIIHDDGRRELYHFKYENLDESISMITLTDTEARQIAGIIGGLTYKPKALESAEIALDDLVIEWVKMEPGFHAIDKNIAELQVRHRTGATIIAVIHKEGTKISPGPDQMLYKNATVVVAGDRHQIKAFHQLIRTGT